MRCSSLPSPADSCGLVTQRQRPDMGTDPIADAGDTLPAMVVMEGEDSLVGATAADITTTTVHRFVAAGVMAAIITTAVTADMDITATEVMAGMATEVTVGMPMGDTTIMGHRTAITLTTMRGEFSIKRAKCIRNARSGAPIGRK